MRGANDSRPLWSARSSMSWLWRAFAERNRSRPHHGGHSVLSGLSFSTSTFFKEQTCWPLTRRALGDGKLAEQVIGRLRQNNINLKLQDCRLWWRRHQISGSRRILRGRFSRPIVGRPSSRIGSKEYSLKATSMERNRLIALEPEGTDLQYCRR